MCVRSEGKNSLLVPSALSDCVHMSAMSAYVYVLASAAERERGGTEGEFKLVNGCHAPSISMTDCIFFLISGAILEKSILG